MPLHVDSKGLLPGKEDPPTSSTSAAPFIRQTVPKEHLKEAGPGTHCRINKTGTPFQLKTKKKKIKFIFFIKTLER